jgi:cation transport protein ChaC
VAKLKLTRESILDGSLRASSMALLGPGTKFMTDEERTRNIATMLAASPNPDRVWVFGFGSLIWNPAFHFVERRTALVHGFHRQFCLWAKAGRGSPQAPGLMLALERGGSCHGVAYRIAPKQVETELDVVWRREMLTGAYRPVWVSAHTPEGVEHAIAFAANHAHERYVRGLDTDETARLLATGSGPLGACCDYLFDTVSHLVDLGIRDRRLEALVERVRNCMGSATPPTLSD